MGNPQNGWIFQGDFMEHMEKPWQNLMDDN